VPFQGPPKAEKVHAKVHAQASRHENQSLRSHNVMKLNHEELPHLPPFGTRQMFSEDDVIEIILNACPQSWVKRVTTTYVE
jgi:hypothetical protein